MSVDAAALNASATDREPTPTLRAAYTLRFYFGEFYLFDQARGGNYYCCFFLSHWLTPKSLVRAPPFSTGTATWDPTSRFFLSPAQGPNEMEHVPVCFPANGRGWYRRVAGQPPSLHKQWIKVCGHCGSCFATALGLGLQASSLFWWPFYSFSFVFSLFPTCVVGGYTVYSVYSPIVLFLFFATLFYPCVCPLSFLYLSAVRGSGRLSGVELWKALPFTGACRVAGRYTKVSRPKVIFLLLLLLLPPSLDYGQQSHTHYTHNRCNKDGIQARRLGQQQRQIADLIAASWSLLSLSFLWVFLSPCSSYAASRRESALQPPLEESERSAELNNTG